VGQLRRLVQYRFEQIYLGRTPFGRKEVNYYRQDIEGIVYLYHPDKQGVNKFDLFWAINVVSHAGKMVDLMTSAVSLCQTLYDRLSTGVIHVADMHRYARRIYQKKRKLQQMYTEIDSQVGKDEQRPLVHILPFAMYILGLENDRPRMMKLVKTHIDRAKVLSRSSDRRFCDGHATRHFDIQTMVVMVVACSRTALGRIVQVTQNCEGVLGVQRTHLEDKHIGDLMSEELAAVHAGLMDSFVRQHDKQYLGVERKRYLRVGSAPVFTQTSMIVKLNPWVGGDPSFLVLVRNEDYGQSFVMVSAERRIVGWSRALWQEWVGAAGLMNVPLGLISRNLEQRFEDKVEDQLKSYFYTFKEKLTAELDRGTVRKLSEAANQVNQDEATAVRRVLKGNHHQGLTLFEGDCEFEVASSIIPKEIRTGIFFEVIISFKSDHGNAPIQLNPRKMETKQMVINSNQSYQKIVQDKGHSMSIFTNANPLVNYQRTRTGTKKLSIMSSSSYSHSLLDKDSDSDSVSRKWHQPIRLNARPGLKVQGAQERKHSFGCHSEIDKSSSSPETFSLRNKVQLVILKKSRTYFWKELIAILFVEIMVWSLSFYITMLMSENFYSNMTKLIDLRHGFHLMSAANTYFWHMEIGLLETLLEHQGYLPKGRYTNPVLFKSKVGLEQEAIDDYKNAMRLSMKFQSHVYLFNWKYSSRYLEFKTPYSMPYTKGSTSNLTRLYNMVDFHRLALYVYRQLYQQLPNVEFNSPLLRIFLDINGGGLLNKILAPTLLFLMEYDFTTYKDLISSTTSIIVSSIIVSVVIANALIGIIYFINKKIVFIYSAFDKIYDFEISYQKQILLELNSALAISVMDALTFRDQI